MNKILITILFLFNILCASNQGDVSVNLQSIDSSDKMYFATSADEKHYSLLLNLIGSIHKIHFDDLGEIAVFNLGFAKHQLEHLKKIAKINVYNIEMTNPALLKPIHTGWKEVRGWFAWKPVAIKQALDIFPYILYIDSGAVILKPINDLFAYIKENNYFFKDCGHSIKWMTTKHVINKFNLLSAENTWILDANTFGLEAGFQGLTRKMYHNYVMPIYELTRDLRNFQDDGTCEGKKGAGREDQTLFSIQARLLNLNIHKRIGTSPMMLSINGVQKPFYIANIESEISDLTQIYQCRWQKVQNYSAHTRLTRSKLEMNFTADIVYKE